MDNYGEIVIYQTEDGLSRIEVNLKDETVWLSIDQMAELFQRDRSVIGKHVRNIFKEGELKKESVWAKFAYTATDGKDYNVDFYNLDVIISVGYRVKSVRGTQFRIWANSVLKEYIIKGFALDDDRLKGTTSVDYNPQSEESITFFKIVQNKLHYAAHGHTVAEVIYERADAEKPFMGLTSFSGELPALKDIGVAKNYLKEDELKILNNLVSGYFDLAEINAIEHKPMYMSDYVEQLDSVLSSGNRKLLAGSGSVSHNQAMKKAKDEYRKYQEITLSPVEEEYLKSIKGVEKEVKKNTRKNSSEGNKNGKNS